MSPSPGDREGFCRSFQTARGCWPQLSGGSLHQVLPWIWADLSLTQVALCCRPLLSGRGLQGGPQCRALPPPPPLPQGALL